MAKCLKDKEFQLMNKLLNSGTASDKISATAFFIDVSKNNIESQSYLSKTS
jgi:hypothetical protein